MTVLGWVWLAIGVGLLVGAVLFGRWLGFRDARAEARVRAMEAPRPTDDPARGRPRPWVVMNPSKLDDPAAFRARVDRLAAEDHGITHVHWLETTPEDPGTGQALRALDLGASVVIAAGGDGTVRAVAAGMAHSGVRMGILPQGTGNLLARNLGIPLDDLGAALAIALGEHHRAIDLAWLRMEDVTAPSTMPPEGALLAGAGAPSVRELPPGVPEPLPDEYSYVVIAGMGFDGETMANADPSLKKAVGWIAYVVSAIGALRVRRMRSHLVLHAPVPAEVTRALDWARVPPRTVGVLAGDPEGVTAGVTASGASGGVEGPGPATGLAGPEDSPALQSLDEASEDPAAPPVADEVADFTARSVLFANCGELPFIVLAPDATLDDGALDVIAVDTQAGILGWVDLASKIFAQGAGWRALNIPTSTGQIAFRQAAGATLTVDRAHVVQVDGDAVGTAHVVHTRVDASSLDISVPTPRTGPVSAGADHPQG